MTFIGGERVRVPNPDGDGTVEAIYVTPSEPGRRHVAYVWVQYAEGTHQGLHEKVRYSEVERADADVPGQHGLAAQP